MKSAFFKILIAALSVALLLLGVTIDMQLIHAQDCSEAVIGKKATETLQAEAKKYSLKPNVEPKDLAQNSQLVDLIDKAYAAVTCTAKLDPLSDAKNLQHFLDLWIFAKLFDRSNELNEGIIQSAGPEKTEILLRHLTQRAAREKKYQPLLDALQTAKTDRPNG